MEPEGSVPHSQVPATEFILRKTKYMYSYTQGILNKVLIFIVIVATHAVS
jgi:hypothetical protein